MRLPRLALLAAIGTVSCAGTATDVEQSPEPPIESSASPIPETPREWLSFENVQQSDEKLVTFGDAPLFEMTARDLPLEPTLVQTHRGANSSTALLAFFYVSPKRPMAPLADGELRRQIGIRLRGQDDCNAIYILWFVGTSPDDTQVSSRPEGIYVQDKYNPGKTKQSQCRDQGFTTYRPVALAGQARDLSGLPGTSSWRLPSVLPGSMHWMIAGIMQDGTLAVVADGHLVWRGELSAHALNFRGPAGIRIDNANFLAAEAADR